MLQDEFFGFDVRVTKIIIVRALGSGVELKANKRFRDGDDSSIRQLGSA